MKPLLPCGRSPDEAQTTSNDITVNAKDDLLNPTSDQTTTELCQLTKLRNHHKNRCIIASLNINSLQNKFDEVKGCQK